MFNATRVAAVFAIFALGGSLALFSVVQRPSEDIAAPATIAPFKVRVVPSTTSPFGTVSGSWTDLVLDFGMDPDPTTPGRTLLAGNTIRVTLPQEFESLGLPADVPAACDSAAGECNTAYLLQGWPDGFFPTTNEYYTLEMDGTHTFVLTATQDLGPGATPGIKQLHLMAPGFINPNPAELFITVESETGPEGALETGMATIIPSGEGNQKVTSTSAFNASSDGSPYPNTVYQQATVGSSPPYSLDILMWGPGGEPKVGTELVEHDLADPHELRWPCDSLDATTCPKEADGVPGSSGDVFDGKYTVGFWYVEGPEGATGQTLIAGPSVAATAPISGIPVGRMPVTFVAGDKPGRYVVTIDLDFTPEVRMIVDVTE